MTPFTTLTGRVARLDRANIDTDQIIPARFLRQPRAGGYGGFLFADLPEVRAACAGASVLAAGANFGCGSSREGAVYALQDAGLCCVIAPSFGDIFAGNAAQNGLLTVVLADTSRIAGNVVVDLGAQTITLADGSAIGFDIDSFRKRRLQLGLDGIGLTLEYAAEIEIFEESAGGVAHRPRRGQRPLEP